jgi:hypothetical protein
MRTTIAVFVLLSLAGCTDTVGPPPDGDVPIRTDRTLYIASTSLGGGWRTQIIWTFTNPTDQLVSVANCLGSTFLKLQKWVGGEWIDAWSPIIPLCLSPPIQVAAGAIHTDTLDFFAAFPGTNAGPQLEVNDINGAYRLVWSPVLNYNDGSGDPLPLEQRVSNAFEMRE